MTNDASRISRAIRSLQREIKELGVENVLMNERDDALNSIINILTDRMIVKDIGDAGINESLNHIEARLEEIASCLECPRHRWNHEC